MADLKVINLATKKEYIIDVSKNGENKMVCPECSEHRKPENRKLKVFSFNLNKKAGRCNHCGLVLVEFKDFEFKPKIEYKRPIPKPISKYSDNAITFFKTRLISEKTLLEMKVSESVEWMPKAKAEIPTIQFNYYRNGELINIKSRGKNKDKVSNHPLAFKNGRDANGMVY